MKSTVSHYILTQYGFEQWASGNDNVWMAAYYLVYKSLEIANTYPTYKAIHITNGTPISIAYFEEDASSYDVASLKELVRKILSDTSHITLKIRQVRNFLPNATNFNSRKYFSYNQYLRKTGRRKGNMVLEEITETLPPPFFTRHISIKRKDTGDLVDMNVMSSGERQFIYSVTSIAYHILKLKSVSAEDCVKYRNCCLIMDEVELCFPPEYQRTFLNNLITMINAFGLNKDFCINILLATHSPFILSDIPKNNILYLKDGRPTLKDNFINPFGANINDILLQSFFLDNGFMGAFAQEKINSLTKFLTGDTDSDRSEWTLEKADKFIELIGDELVATQLRILRAKKCSNESSAYKKWLESELERISQ